MINKLKKKFIVKELCSAHLSLLQQFVYCWCGLKYICDISYILGSVDLLEAVLCACGPGNSRDAQSEDGNTAVHVVAMNPRVNSPDGEMNVSTKTWWNK